MDWLEVAVSTLPEGIEPVADTFFELGAGGVVIEDPAVLAKYAGEVDPEEWAAPDFFPGLSGPVVKGYLPLDQMVWQQLAALYSALNNIFFSAPPAVTIRTVCEVDWSNAWRAYYKPVRIGRRLLVKPVWEGHNNSEGNVIIELDPGMAFGCGTHPSTIMCLKLLEDFISGGEMVYDVGTGSGILAVAAAKLGAGRVIAIDRDQLAVRVARENVKRNNVEDLVQVTSGNMLEGINEPANLIVANIIADTIIRLAPRAAHLLLPGGRLIASGIIAGRADDVCKALRASALTLQTSFAEGDWVAFVCEKK